MRAKEFLLLEYRRDVTAQKMGDRLITSFHAKENGHSLPDNLYGAWTVVDMVIRPKFHFEDTIVMNVLGQKTTINKATAPEILQKIKPALIDAILAALEQGDPTAHKEYTQWIAARYITGDTKLEDVSSTLREYLHKFVILKRKKILKPPANDINRYNSFGNFMDNMDEYALPEDEVADKGKVTEMYKDAEVRIVVPEDEPAACYYGRGTRWCTAATQGSNYFNHYSRQGPLYILIPTHAKYEGEKYQLHFPSEQFMDEQDESVSLEYIINDRFHVLDFFKQQEPELKDYVAYTDEEQLTPLLAKIKEVAMDWLWDEVMNWEQQDDYYTQWQAEQARERGWEDENGDVDWDRVREDDHLNNYLEWNDEVRTWVKEIETALDYSPKMVKDFASAPRDGLDDQTYKMEELDALLARIVNYETGKAGSRDFDYIASAIVERIGVRKDSNRISNNDPVWTVYVSGWPRH
jgi:hypothetical protein